jgi:hypothetical protein
VLRDLEAARGSDRRFAWSTSPADQPGAPDHRDLRLLAPELDFVLRLWGALDLLRDGAVSSSGELESGGRHEDRAARETVQ